MTVKYASVIIDISHESVDRIFQYRIPEDLQEEVKIGSQVCVPFGSGNRRRKGYVVEITEKAAFDEARIKEVAGLVKGSVTADSRLLELAWWMKERYGSTMHQALKTALPVKRRVKARNQQVVKSMIGDLWSWKEAEKKPDIFLNEQQQQVVDAFCRDYDKGERTPYLIHGITGSGKTEVYMTMMTMYCLLAVR